VKLNSFWGSKRDKESLKKTNKKKSLQREKKGPTSPPPKTLKAYP